MSIAPISLATPAASTEATSSATTTSTSETKNAMNADMFMKLLVTQLTNQDPSSPMDSTQMIAQTTQLAMMEKLTELSKTGTENFSLQMRTAAASMLGQQVSYEGDDGQTVTGTATAVSFASGVPVVTIGTKNVPLDVISGIARTSAS